MRPKRFLSSLACFLLIFCVGGRALASTATFSKKYVELMLAHIHSLALARAADTYANTVYNPKNLSYDQANFDKQENNQSPLEYQYSSLAPYVMRNGGSAASADTIKALFTGHIIHAVAMNGLPVDFASVAIPAYTAEKAKLSDYNVNVGANAADLSETNLRDAVAEALQNQTELGHKKVWGYVLGQTLQGELPLMSYLWAGLTATDASTKDADLERSRALYTKLAAYLDRTLEDIEYRLLKKRTVASKLPLVTRVDLNSLRRNAATTVPTYSAVPGGAAPVEITALWTEITPKEDDVIRYVLRTRYDAELSELVSEFAGYLDPSGVLPAWAGAAGAGGVKVNYQLNTRAKMHNAGKNLSNLLAKGVQSKLDWRNTATANGFTDEATGAPAAKTKINNVDDYKNIYRTHVMQIKNPGHATHATFKDNFHTYPQFMYEINTAALRRLKVGNDPQFLKKGELLSIASALTEEAANNAGKLGQRSTMAEDTAWGVFRGIMTEVQPHIINAAKHDKWVSHLKAFSGHGFRLLVKDLATLAKEASTTFQTRYNEVNARANAPATTGIEQSKKRLYEYLRSLVASEALLTDGEVGGFLGSINSVNSEVSFRTVVTGLNAANKRIDYFPAIGDLSSAGFNSQGATKSGRDPSKAPRTPEQAKDDDVTLASERQTVARRMNTIKAHLAGRLKRAPKLTPKKKSELKSEFRKLEKTIKLQNRVLKLSPKDVRKELSRLQKKKTLGTQSQELLRMLKKRQSDLVHNSKLREIDGKIVKKTAQIRSSKSPTQKSKLRAELKKLEEARKKEKYERDAWKAKRQEEAKTQKFMKKLESNPRLMDKALRL